MSKVQDFIASGIINEYCLGLLQTDEIREVERMAGVYPAIKQAIDQARRVLKPLEKARTEPADTALKNRILGVLDQLGEPPAFDLHNLPLINAYSDPDQWRRTVASLQPTRAFQNLYVHPLQEKDGLVQCLLWAKREVKPEEHHDEYESFLILEGQCECRIGAETVRLSAGDYVAIPLDVEHRVQVLSPDPVKAILQRVKR